MKNSDVPVSVAEAMNYLGIDVQDESVNFNISRAIKTADAYLKSAVSENYPIDDPRVKELALMIVADLYDSRGLMASDKVSQNVRHLANNYLFQLRIEANSKENA